MSRLFANEDLYFCPYCFYVQKGKKTNTAIQQCSQHIKKPDGVSNDHICGTMLIKVELYHAFNQTQESRTKKSTLGILPKHLWDAERRQNLLEAITQHNKANIQPPAAWLIELEDLFLKLKSREIEMLKLKIPSQKKMAKIWAESFGEKIRRSNCFLTEDIALNDEGSFLEAVTVLGFRKAYAMAVNGWQATDRKIKKDKQAKTEEK